MSTTSRNILVLALLGIVAVGLAFVSLRRDVGPDLPNRPEAPVAGVEDPRATRAVGEPGAAVDGVRPLVTRGAGPDAVAADADAGGGPGAPAVRGIAVGEPPTWEDVEHQFRTFDKITLQTEVEGDDPRARDLEASVRLRQKTIALRDLANLVDRGLSANSIPRGDALRRLDQAGDRMADAIASAPVPSHVDDPEAWRDSTIDVSLRVLEPLTSQQLDDLAE